MNHIKIISFSTAILFIICCAFNVSNAQQRQDMPNYKIADHYRFVLTEELTMSPDAYFIQYKQDMELTDLDRFELKFQRTDSTGNTHYRFNQKHDGLQIEGVQYIIHVNNRGKIYCTNGKIVSRLHIDQRRIIEPETAIQWGLKAAPAKTYIWEGIQTRDNDNNGNVENHYPQPILGIVFDAKNNRYRKAYTMHIQAIDPPLNLKIAVDATSGNIIDKTSIDRSCVPTVNDAIYYSDVTFYTDEYRPGKWQLYNDCDETKILVQNWGSSDEKKNPQKITSSSNTWNSNTQKFGASILWGFESTLSYYSRIHNWQSYDNDNGNIKAYVNAVYKNTNGLLNTNNAVYHGKGEFSFGIGSGINDAYASLDVVGHEFTHGVIASSSNLIYQGESGALNESFSDIMGEMLEQREFGSGDWLVLAERKNNGALRSFSQPSNFNQPEAYKDAKWGNTGAGASDNGGVHTNSGVGNFWFYLMTVGGTGTNTLGTNYEVNGIGRFKSRKIAFNTITNYLVNDSNYEDARQASIQAAVDLYGECSFEAIQCGKAWYAVGVGNTYREYWADVPCVNRIDGQKYSGIRILRTQKCDTKVRADKGNVFFTAGRGVVLKQGFDAKSNGKKYFEAKLDDCAFTLRDK